MKTFAAILLTLAAGSAMACPGDKSVSTTPSPTASTTPSVAKVQTVQASDRSQAVVQADARVAVQKSTR